MALVLHSLIVGLAWRQHDHKLEAHTRMSFDDAPKSSTITPQPRLDLFPGASPGERTASFESSPDVRANMSDVPTITYFYCARPPTSIGCTTVLVMPGGGFDYLDHNMAEPIAEVLQSMGFSAVVLRYRTPTTTSAAGPSSAWGPLIDAQRAMRLVRHMATAGPALGKVQRAIVLTYNFILWVLNVPPTPRAIRLGSHPGCCIQKLTTDIALSPQVDPSAIGLMGMSAGGALGVSLAARWTESLYAPFDAADAMSARPDFCIAMYPSSLNTTQHHIQGTMEAVDQQARAVRWSIHLRAREKERANISTRKATLDIVSRAPAPAPLLCSGGAT
jgi:acetyl esterase/lipase